MVPFPGQTAVKTPLGVLVLWAAGTVTVTVGRLRPVAPYPLPAPAVLPAAAPYGSREFGTRCVVFLSMFPAVAASCALAVCRRQRRRRRWRSSRWARRGRSPSVRRTPTRRPAVRRRPVSGRTTRTPTGVRPSAGPPADRPKAVPREADPAGPQGRRGVLVPRHPRRVPPAEVHGVPGSAAAGATGATGRVGRKQPPGRRRRPLGHDPPAPTRAVSRTSAAPRAGRRRRSHAASRCSPHGNGRWGPRRTVGRARRAGPPTRSRGARRAGPAGR